MPRNPSSEMYITVTDRWKSGETGERRWRIRVWSSVERRHVSRSFADPGAGMTWARALRPKLELQQERATPVHFAALRDLFLERLRFRRCSERHIAQVGSVAQRVIDAGLDDPIAPGFARQVEALVSGLLVTPRGGTPAQRGGMCPRQQRPLSARSRNMLRGMLRAICRHGVRHRILPYNPLEVLDREREVHGIRPTFTLPELCQLIDASLVEDPWQRFVCLAIYTGARSTEVRHITWQMVQWEQHVLLLPGDLPGNKSRMGRIIYLQPELEDMLRRVGGVGTGYIVNEHLRNMASSSVTRGFRDYCTRAGVAAGTRGPHALRHTWCAVMTATGTPTLDLMLQAGHTTHAITRHYASEAMRYVHQTRRWGIGRFWLQRDPPGRTTVDVRLLMDAIAQLTPEQQSQVLDRMPASTVG